MPKRKFDLVELAERFLNRWVALDPEDQSVVLASGDTAKAVLQEAESKGVPSPLILWVTNDYGSYAP